MQHKALVSIKQRALTFSMVFAVVLAAAAITITSTAVRTVSCQARADELMLPILVSPFISNSTLFEATLVALKRRDLNIRFKRDNETLRRELAVLDFEGRLAKRGFRLVSEKRGEIFTWSLRYLSTRLCGTVPPLSMDAASNSDYETDNRRVVATLPNETVFFVRESSLTSRSAGRITDYDTFQSAFPSFRKVAGSGPWDRAEGYTVETIASRPITDSRGNTAVRLDFEKWSKLNKAQFWRIVVRTSNPNEQDSARAVFSLLKEEYSARGLGYGGLAPADLFDWCGIA